VISGPHASAPLFSHATSSSQILRTNAFVIGATAVLKARSLTSVLARVPHDPPPSGTQGVGIEADPVNPLELPGHVIAQDFRDLSCYYDVDR